MGFDNERDNSVKQLLNFKLKHWVIYLFNRKYNLFILFSNISSAKKESSQCQ